MNNNAPDKLRPMSFQWALALTFVAWFIEVMLTIVLRPVLVHDGLQPMAAASLIRVLCYGGVFSVMLHNSGLTYRQLFHSCRASVAATLGLLGPPILLLVPLVVVLDIGVMWLLVQLLPMSGAEERWFTEGMTGGIGSWVLVCGIAPLVEEMFFRGILLRGMLKRYAPADAIVYSAFVFGFAHLNVYQFVIAFAIGLFAAVLYRRTQSLWPGIMLHAGLNTSVMVLAVSGVDLDASLPSWAWVAALASGLLGAWWLRSILWRARSPVPVTPATDAGSTQPPPDAA